MACLDVTAFLGFLPTFASTGSTSVGSIAWLSTGTAGDTITIGSVTMTAVAGARVAGSSTWSVDGPEAQEAASFRAAVADSAAAALVTASGSGATVSLRTTAKGPVSLLDLSTSAAEVYGLTPFAGGDDQIRLTLEATCPMVGDCFGAKAGLAHAYLTAHFLDVAAGLEGGVRTSRAINKISEGSSAPSFDAGDAAFATTRWGRLFLALRSSVVVMPMTTAINFMSTGGCGCG
jgi:hypothetical protein